MYVEMTPGSGGGGTTMASGTFTSSGLKTKTTINTGLSTINGFVLYVNLNSDSTRYSCVVYDKNQNSTKYLSALGAGTTCQGLGFVTWNNNNTNNYSFSITGAPSGGTIEVMAPNNATNVGANGYWFAW